MGSDNQKFNYHEFNEKYISDGIKEDYKQWHIAYTFNSSTKVFLESPTGTGKTHFLINVLLKYAIEQKRSIVYICNREALRKQIEHELSKPEYNLTKDMCFVNSNFSVFLYPGATAYYPQPGIVIANYQSISIFNSFHQLCNHALSNLFYVFLDEVHFFLEDALFNTKTDSIRHYIFTEFQQQVQIYTSATILDFMDLYLDIYKYYIPKHPLQQIYQEVFYKYHAEYYHNSYARPVYNLILYSDENYLYEEIEKSENDKWLIFVSSKTKGSELKKEISKFKKCIMITSDKKNPKTWEKLVNECKFPQDVFIATKVIDNGVSIKDDAVRNIVVPFSYNTEFVQMIGRVRIDDETPLPINLYVKLPSIQEIRSRLKKFEYQLNLICNVENAKTMNYKLKIIRNYWNKPEYANSFTFSFTNGFINMYTNVLCVYKLCTNIEFYKFLEENRFDSLRIYKRILDSWLEGRIIDYKNKFVHFDLVKYLEKHIGCPFEDTSQFYRDFLELYAVYCNILFERKEINKEEFTDKMKLRKGTGRNKSTINKALSNLNLPYVIKKKNNCWIIEKIPQ